MNRDNVVEQNLVERYLRNELSDEESAEFEAFYMDDPETLDELEAAQILLSQKKMPAPVNESAPAHRATALNPDPASRRRNPWQWVSGALAAALVVALVFPQVRVVEHSGAVSHANVLPLFTTRSNESTVPRVNAANIEGVLIAQLPVMYMSAEDYRIEIRRNGHVIYQDESASASADMVHIVIPRDQLAVGNYTMDAVGLRTGQVFKGAWEVTK